jgi:hypothetical protein
MKSALREQAPRKSVGNEARFISSDEDLLRVCDNACCHVVAEGDFLSLVRGK